MDEYIRKLTEQIRCERVRSEVADEVKNHILDQAEYYESKGLQYDEAMSKAVKSMGDPVEAGTELDHIHRPQMDWSMLILVVILNIVGVLLQSILIDDFPLLAQFKFIAIGTALMIGIYYLDYSCIVKYIRYIYPLYFVYTVMIYFLLGRTVVNGRMVHRSVFILSCYAFIFVYAAVIYSNRNKGITGLVRCGISFIPLFAYFYICYSSLPLMLSMILIVYSMTVFAIAKGWFNINRFVGIAITSVVGIVMPAVSGILWYCFGMASYQKMRIEAILHPELYKEGANYVPNLLRKLVGNASMFGGATSQYAPNDYIITQIMCSYGIMAVLLVMAVFAVIIFKVFNISVKQKNMVGTLMGFGFGIMLIINILSALFMNLGILPGTTVVLPFLTYGGGAIVGYSAFFGVILSIYRYKNIITDKNIGNATRYRIRIEREM